MQNHTLPNVQGELMELLTRVLDMFQYFKKVLPSVESF